MKPYLDWGSWLLIIGLLMVVWGAWLTAQAVIIDADTADKLSGTYWGGNTGLRDALIAQSRAAKGGLYWIGAGSLLQIAGVVLQAFKA